MPMGTACEYMLLVSTRIEQPKNVHLESMNISVKKYIEKEPKNLQTDILATISNLRWALEAGSKMLRHHPKMHSPKLYPGQTNHPS